jgi:hypothetical protein
MRLRAERKLVASDADREKTQDQLSPATPVPSRVTRSRRDIEFGSVFTSNAPVFTVNVQQENRIASILCLNY